MGVISRDIKIAEENFAKQLCFREDISRRIRKLEEAIENGNTDREPTLRQDIFEMFRICGIACDRTLSPEAFSDLLKKSDIPSIKTFSSRCWNELIGLFKSYRAPEAYIERLVDALGDPAYKVGDTTLRVRILKQFLGHMGGLAGTRFCSKELNTIIEDEYGGDICAIDDEIFRNHLAAGHFVQDHKALRIFLDVYGDLLYSDGENDEELNDLVARFDPSVKGKNARETLAVVTENNPATVINAEGKAEKIYVIRDRLPGLVSEIKAHIEKVVRDYKAGFDNDLSAIKDAKKDRAKQFDMIAGFVLKRGLFGWIATDEFFGLVEKQTGIMVAAPSDAAALLTTLSRKANEHPRDFAKINDFLVRRIKKFLSEKSNNCSSQLDNARTRTPVIEILRVCSDFATGVFKTNREMRERLYLFAFAFDMSAVPKDGEPMRDITKNLFEDYYCDNIVRYLAEDYQKAGVYDEPIGITINYKNFVEVVCLYWLNKDSRIISPYNKYLSANKMIKRIVDTYRARVDAVERGEGAADPASVGRKELGTEYYRYLLEGDRYPYADYYADEKRADMMNMKESELEEFILENYDIDLGKNYSGEGAAEAFENEDGQEMASLCIDELYKKINPMVSCDTRSDLRKKVNFTEKEDAVIDAETEKKLLFLIDRMNDRIFKVLTDENERRTTRSCLMFLYFCSVLYDLTEKESYYDLFNDHRREYWGDELDKMLIECSYQPFSNKNLIDMILLFSAFISSRSDL